MTSYDVLFRGGTVVTANKLFAADVAAVDGRIVAVEPRLDGSAVEFVDAAGLHLFGTGRTKGQIAPGFDADIALVDLEGRERIAAAQLLYRHPISPYLGLELRAVVRGPRVRGRAVYRDGKVTGEARGRLVTRERES
jgi:dihydroorotase-like cyclic amidohydrolase